MGTVALWAPEIIPPDEWLVPALLYQERIATVSPMESLHDRDGRKALYLAETLGDLWNPVRFEPEYLPIREVLESRLALCVQLAYARQDSANDVWTRQWLERVDDWPAKRMHRLSAALADAERQLAELQAEHSDLLSVTGVQDDALEVRRQRITAELADLAPSLRDEKQKRRDALADLKAAEPAYRRGARGVDPDADAALDELHRQMRAVLEVLDEESSPARRRQVELQAELQEIATTVRQLRARAVAAREARRRIADAERRVRNCRDRVQYPWSHDPPLGAYEGQYASFLADGLESIGWGKVGGDSTYQHLATRGGLWSVEHRNAPWAHSLIGPTWVVEDLLVTLAELLVASRPDWALAGRLTHLAEPRVGPRERALAVGFSLPAPASGSAADAVRFRMEHEDELQALRDSIDAQIAVDDIADLRDAIADVRHLIAEPVAEVKRALELNRRLGCRAIALATLREVPPGLQGLAAGSLATLLASPIVGEPLTTPGVLGAAIGGAALVGARLGVTTWRAGSERRRLERGVLAGPYRYVYDVGRQFGFA